jgi:hypothetical protein
VTEGDILAFVQPDTNLPKKLTPVDTRDPEYVVGGNGDAGIGIARSMFGTELPIGDVRSSTAIGAHEPGPT